MTLPSCKITSLTSVMVIGNLPSLFIVTRQLLVAKFMAVERAYGVVCIGMVSM